MHFRIASVFDGFLGHATQALHRGCQAPPAMMARRRKYRNSKTASAYIAKNSDEPFSPTYTILFREFCEVMTIETKAHDR